MTGSTASAEELREIAARDGIDAATSLLYRNVLDSPHHGPFIRRVQEIGGQAQPAAWASNASLVIVPGAFYRENPRSGADGRLLREQAERLGCPVEILPIASTGSIRENGRMICDWLAERSERSEGAVLLASLSKGGADVKAALAVPGAEHAFKNVAAWISLCGILDGTPMADWLLSRAPGALLIRLVNRLRGQNRDFLHDLRYGAGRPLDFALPLPPHVRLISIVGFPLREHLERAIARRCHRRLTALGPNDGALVLADVCALPGLVYPLWGADHYLQPKTDVRELVAAILQYLDETLR